MKFSMLVVSALLSAATLSVPSFAAENTRAAMALCDCSNPANHEICSRLQQSSALERDSSLSSSSQNHGGAQRAPAGLPAVQAPARR